MSSAPPDEVIFFVDRSLGRAKVAEALHAAGASVRLHDDLFALDVADSVWLTHAGSQGWIVLTKDRRIRYRALEKGALFRAGVRAFVLTGGNMTGESMGAAFATALPAMRRLASKQPAPFIASVSSTGAVALLNAGR